MHLTDAISHSVNDCLRPPSLALLGVGLPGVALVSLRRRLVSISRTGGMQGIFGGPCRDRTYDQEIKSLLLYQLS